MKKKNTTPDLTVIVGAMFSGKSSTLCEFMVRYEIAGVKTLVFKPEIDDRGEGKDLIKTHADQKISAIPIKNPQEILKFLKPEIGIVGVDEVQFFPSSIVELVKQVIEKYGIKVIVAGLPTDFRGEPFGSMPTLLALADNIIQCKAVCTFSADGGICGEEATRTQRLIDGQPANYSEPIVRVGGQELYEARCVKHHIIPGKKNES